MAAAERKDSEAFLAQAVHDWRQPLQAALGHVELALGQDLPAKARLGLEEAADALQRLADGFGQALAYVRSGQTADEGPVDLRAVLDEACRDLHPVLQEAGAQVACDELPVVPGDRLLLGRLLQNLLANAVKYHGPAPPRIHVWADATPTGWRLNVQDNGVGMSPEQVASLGRPFRRYRPDLASGTGLGLASCHRIAQAHGGRLWATSGPSGSTLHVDLPRQAPDRPKAP